MAIITISRQVAAWGDEVAVELAKQLNYKFIKRKDIERRIIDLGFPEAKMPKFDERKPGFFASLTKDRDEYLNYVQYATLEAASQKDSIIIGRGAFAVLQGIPNVVSVRLVADEKTRIERLKKEFSWTDKQAKQRISESDVNRDGYHNSFYNVNVDDASLFHLVLNTGLIAIPDTATIISNIVKTLVTPDKEDLGNQRIERMLMAQKAVNKIIFEHHMNIEFVHASVEDMTVILHGVSESPAVVEQALQVLKDEMPGFEVKSAVSIVHDFKAYQ